VFRMLPPGTFTTSGLRNSADFRVHVAEDKNGWTGSSPLIVSFYAPTWLVLLESQNAEFVNVLLNLLSVVFEITVSVTVNSRTDSITASTFSVCLQGCSWRIC